MEEAQQQSERSAGAHATSGAAASVCRSPLADWRSLALVTAIAFVGVVSFQGTRGLYHTTEGRYAECARETMQSGNYLVPQLDGKPHWTKPPLTYLSIMAGLRVFGDSPWGVRAYLVLAMVLAAGAVWWAGVSIWGPQAGRWAGIVFATSPYVVGTASVVATDALVMLWTAWAVAAFWHSHARHSRWAALLMWLSLGLASFTKGPPALLVPALASVYAWASLRRQGAWRNGIGTTLLGVALFGLVGCGWYVWQATLHPELVDYWIGHELVARNLTNEFNRSPGFHHVLIDYIPIMLAGTGPWLLLVLARRRTGRDTRRPASTPATPWQAVAHRSLVIGGVLVPFAVFVLSKSKLPLYLAPLFVPLCLVVGRSLDLLLAEGRLSRRAAAWTTGAMLCGIIIGKAIFGIPERAKDMTRLATRVAPVLAREAPESVYTVGQRPLDGLEFHLRRKVANLETGALAAHLDESLRAGRRTLYIIKKSGWERVVTNANATASVRVEPLGPLWMGVWSETPPAPATAPRTLLETPPP